MATKSGAGTPELEIRLLGSFEALRAGEPLTVGGLKPRSLLAVLALEPGRVVSVDALVEALWPGEPPETAAHAVQVYVSQLRKVCGSVIATRPPGYVLDVAPERIDVHRFERLSAEGREALRADAPEVAEAALRKALALWRGPALGDFMYEPFAQSDIARLDELRTIVLEERIEADLALGRHADLVPELEALVLAQPLRDRPRAQLMLALYRSGRQADALAAYRAARETLIEELGIDPGPELKELEAAILRQDESLQLSAGTPATPAMQFRRFAAILFVDIVESVALAESLDPEALASVQRRYFDTVSAAITHHGGTIERLAGDAVIAAFGVPVAHEDDALRAANAAFDVLTGIGALNQRLAHDHELALDVRIGVAAGEVVATATGAGQRFVAGDPVGIAARLQQAAGPGEIVVGEVVARMIDHAALLEPIGSLDIPGRKASFAMFRLREITSAAPAFARRQDAPFVGRKGELAALRTSLRRAVESRSTRAVVVIAPAGVGKSRLAAEFTRRARGVSALWGRCLSYGDGITYWPLREVLTCAEESEARDAVLAALDAEIPVPAAEIASLFRRFAETSARERPLVLVFDDVHWAEPTFVQLIENLVDRGDGPIQIVCLAREELRESKPELLEGRASVDLVEVEALSAAEADLLLEALGGAILESDQRSRIATAGEGNPFFVEQLLALALDGGIAEGVLPPTVQSLLAARLDRLGPGERAILERAAIVGKEFTETDVLSLLDPDAVPTAPSHLLTLTDRGFIRPLGDGVLAFRHALVLEAVYRSSPKRLRAELHERYADRLDEAWADLPELDEFVGFHLEQAYRLRAELGEAGDRRAEQLGNDAGRRLGRAGFGALKRADMEATSNLLGRAVELLGIGDELRNELMSELAIAQYVAGDHAGARTTLDLAIAAADGGGLRRVALRARIESAYLDLLTEPEGAASDLLRIAQEAVPTFEALDDHRSLARVWLLTGYVRGGIHGQHAAWQDAEERALVHYRATGFPPATCLGQIAAALYWGPTPVSQGIARCVQLLEEQGAGRSGRAAVAPYLGGLHAQAGRFTEARELVDEAEATYTDLGSPAAVVHCGTVRADVELLAGNFTAAEATLRDQCAYLESVHDRAHLAVRAAKLAEVLYRQMRLEEAEEWVGVSHTNAASDDQSAQVTLGIVESKLLARQGALAAARSLAEKAVQLAESTDGLNQVAAARVALADVLFADGCDIEARASLEEALVLYGRKENVVGASRVRAALGGEVALVREPAALSGEHSA